MKKNTAKLLNLNERMIKAIIKDDFFTVNKLLCNGADPNGYVDSYCLTPLHFAAQNNAIYSAFLLISAGANPCVSSLDDDFVTPLEIAAAHRHYTMVNILTYLSKPNISWH